MVSIYLFFLLVAGGIYLIPDLLFFRLEPVQLVFVIIGAVMGALGLMNLFVGCLATGATRHKVYRTWRGRVGGRVSCAVVSFPHIHSCVQLFPSSFVSISIFPLNVYLAVHGHHIHSAVHLAFDVVLLDCCNSCIHNVLESLLKPSCCCGTPMHKLRLIWYVLVLVVKCSFVVTIIAQSQDGFSIYYRLCVSKQHPTRGYEGL